MRWGWAGQVLQVQHWHPKTGIQTPRGFSGPCTGPGVSLEGRRVLAVVGCASLGLFLLHIILVSLEHELVLNHAGMAEPRAAGGGSV